MATGVEVYCKSTLLCWLASWVERVDCGRSMQQRVEARIGAGCTIGKGKQGDCQVPITR